jgi:hypothetical protein
MSADPEGLEPESLYARLPESTRSLIEKHLRKHLLETLSPSEVERDFPQYFARNQERMAREWHRQFGEDMATAALRDKR